MKLIISNILVLNHGLLAGSTLMIGFTAQYKSGEIKIQEEEIEAAGFYTAFDMPGRPSSNFSISSLMINDFYHKAAKD